MQEDLGPPFYMIAREEIPKEPRDTMSQNNPSLGPRGAPILEEEETWREGRILLIKVHKT